MHYPLGCLFSGVGRLEAGLALAGYEAAWQIEANPFRRRVLEQRFGAPVLEDIREARGLPKVRALCGGFPCQDLSGAGPRVGIRGERSFLWSEYARLIAELEPEVCFIENVPPLLYRGFDLVVRDLVEMGYSVEWDCIPAAAVGLPHLRDRVWIVAERGGLEPEIFGEPASLFPEPPQAMAEGEWRRWPRAGFVCGDPDSALALQPLAPMAEVKRGLILWPTPHGIAKEGAPRRPGPSGNKLGHAVNRVERGEMWPTPWASLANYDERPEVWVQRQKHKENPREEVGRSSLPLGVAVRMWPTPVCSDGRGSRRATARTEEWASKEGTTLTDAAHMAEDPERWPTPTVSDSKGASPNLERDGSPNLAERVEEMWPTPNAADGSGGRNEMAAIERGLEEGREDLRTLARPSGAKAAVSLRTAAEGAERGLWPTPRASGDHESGGGEMTTYRRTPSQQAGTHGKYLQVEANEAEIAAGAESMPLNPDWVEALMGMPVGWTNPEVANEDLRLAPIPVGPTDTPPPDEPQRTADNVPMRQPRLAACGDSLVAEIPARVASSRGVR